MDVLLELLIKLLSLTVIMIFLIGLLFVMLISVVYIADMFTIVYLAIHL